MPDDNTIRTMRESMLALIDSVAGMRDRFGSFRIDGPVASAEKPRHLQPVSIDKAFATSVTLIGVAEEHMTAFTQSTGITQYTSARDMLEPCALVTWLLNPTVDERERAGRVFAYQYSDQEEMRKCYSAASITFAEQDAKDRISKLAAEAGELGYNILQMNGKIVGIHKRLPKTTPLVGGSLGKEEEKAYRVLSAIAHGHMWAIHSFAYKWDLTGLTAEVNDNPSTLNWIGTIATRAYCKAVWAYGNYLAWPQRDLADPLEKTCSSLKIPDTDRPWK